VLVGWRSSTALLSTFYFLLRATAHPREVIPPLIRETHPDDTRVTINARPCSFDFKGILSQRSQRDMELNSKAIEYAGI